MHVWGIMGLEQTIILICPFSKKIIIIIINKQENLFTRNTLVEWQWINLVNKCFKCVIFESI